MTITAGSSSQGDPTDELLLHDYVTGQDGGAFAAIVRRHGGMVLGVCMRILRHQQDAEDAFQATFLVLMRKARSLTKPRLLANWLHGVAYRIAAKIKATVARQRTREAPMVDLPAPDADADVVWRDLRSVLDDEVQRLPLRYRTPVVLFYLEGKTVEEVASVLGCPKGTVLSQLARARERLRRRLAWRRVALSTGLLATLLSRTASAHGAVPQTLLDWSVRVTPPFAAAGATEDGISAQARLAAQQVLKDMTWNRLRPIGALLLAGLLTIGIGIMTCRTGSSWRGASGQEVSVSDSDRLSGDWQVVAMVDDGRSLREEEFLFTRLRIRGDSIILEGGRRDLEMSFRLDPGQEPKAIDMQVKGYANQTYFAIYALDGDTLRICRPNRTEIYRPTQFASKPKSGVLFLTAKRMIPLNGKAATKPLPE
jgi:RNA polymerase sigma factor (sigma-70 family)